MKKSTTMLLLIIAALLIALSLIYPVRADVGRSIYDGVWNIIFTSCSGQTVVYEAVKVVDVNDTFISFTDSRGKETKLPLTSTCSEVVMQRER